MGLGHGILIAGYAAASAQANWARSNDIIRKLSLQDELVRNAGAPKASLASKVALRLFANLGRPYRSMSGWRAWSNALPFLEGLQARGLIQARD